MPKQKPSTKFSGTFIIRRVRDTTVYYPDVSAPMYGICLEIESSSKFGRENRPMNEQEMARLLSKLPGRVLKVKE